ncbi:transglycosylase SLT domain-containing protein [Streptomyces sp. NPDC047061]|uniref:transglycosylase SLT domain-containing protein n=1 Tax=Streptomyces sp. NPDC047061 TaxID=3154605 RepID=UPI0033C7AE00
MSGESGESGGQGTGTLFLVLGVVAAILPIIAGMLALCIVLVTIIVEALSWVFWPLMFLCDIHVLHCGGDSSGTGSVDSDKVAAVYQSDGRGALNTANVPADFLQPIQDAGLLCTQIGPIVIAAQIQQESGFNSRLEGLDGAEGISQLPPDKFKEFGEDDDDNGDVSALDPEDSIMAQGRYLCSLAKDIDTLRADQAVEGNALDLTLAAYDLGIDAVKQAKGIPKSSSAQAYVIGVRSGFVLFSDAVELSDGQTYPSLSPRPTPTS